jgi:hypothetical protein
MRQAPPVSLSAGGGALWRALRIVLPALSAALLTHWGLLHLQGPAAAGWALPVVVLAALAAAALALRWTSSAATELCWDGSRWSADGEGGRLDVMIDLQRWLLLRLRPTGRRRGRWIAVAAGEAGAQFALLRAVLHSAVPELETDAAPEPAEAGADAGPRL